MRVCVPLLSSPASIRDGMRDGSAHDLPLARHFGLAECFAVIDSVSGDMLGECRISGHCPGACHCPLPDLTDSRVDVLAGQAIGFRLMQLSRRAGLPVLAVQAHTLDELRDEIRDVSSTESPVRASMPAPVCLTGGRRSSAGQRG